MNHKALIRLVGAIVIVTLMVVTIAPTFDLDPSALRAQRSAHLILWALTAMPQAMVALSEHSGLDSPPTEVVARIPGVSGIATSLLC